MHLLNTIVLAILFFHPHTLLQKNSTENVIINKVGSLPEVKSFVEKARGSKPSIMIAGKPDRDNKYYWVKVGLGNDACLERCIIFTSIQNHQKFII